jgi:hypothetical protein
VTEGFSQLPREWVRERLQEINPRRKKLGLKQRRVLKPWELYEVQIRDKRVKRRVKTQLTDADPDAFDPSDDMYHEAKQTPNWKYSTRNPDSPNFRQNRYDHMIHQARKYNLLDKRVVYHTSDPEFARFLNREFRGRGFSNLDVVYTPPVPIVP